MNKKIRKLWLWSAGTEDYEEGVKEKEQVFG